MLMGRGQLVTMMTLLAPAYGLDYRTRVAFEQLAPQLDVVEPSVEVADDISVVDIRDGVTLTKYLL
jgi:hypothetical protein